MIAELARAAALVDGVTEVGKSALFTLVTGAPNALPTPVLPAARSVCWVTGSV